MRAKKACPSVAAPRQAEVERESGMILCPSALYHLIRENASVFERGYSWHGD